MVHVGVREQDRIDFRWIEGEGFAIERFDRARPLEEAAIDEDAPPPQRHLEAGARNGTGGAMNGQRRSDHMLTVNAGVTLARSGTTSTSCGHQNKVSTAWLPR